MSERKYHRAFGVYGVCVENDKLLVINKNRDPYTKRYDLRGTTRLIQFPQGEYIVIKGEADTDEELSNKLTDISFGEVLMEVTDVSYVGGPNAAVVMEQQDGLVYGEMWIPVVKN